MDCTADTRFTNIEPLKSKLWLSSPTMHGYEKKWVDEAIQTNWVSTVGANINVVEENITSFLNIPYRVRENSLSKNHSMKSLIDFWLSNLEKCNALYDKLSDSTCQQKLIETCLNAINRMMRWYYGCTKEEKKSAGNTIKQMKSFVDEHFKKIVFSSNYSMYFKITAICTKVINPVLLWMINKAVNIHLLHRKGKRYS